MTKKMFRFKDANKAAYPNWTSVKWDELGYFFGGLTGKTKADFCEGNEKFITYMNVFSNVIANPNDLCPVQIAPSEKQNKVKRGDILLTQSSETAEEAGMSSLWNEEQEVYLNSFCFGFRITSPDIDPIFFVYLLRSNSCRENIVKEAQGISRYNLSPNRLKNLTLNIPSIDEQQKIASFFSTLDDKISLTEKKLSTISRLKKGIFKKILSRNIRFLDEKGNAFPEWSNKKIGEIFSISAGGDLDKSRASKDFNEEFCYKVFANALTNDGLYGYANYYLVDGETVTVTGRGDIGYAVARHEKYVPIVRLLVCKPIEKQNVDYYAELINNIRILNESTGVPQLTRPQLAEITVSVPVLEEQDKIAALINTLNKLIKVNKSKVVQLQKLKQSLLKEMFV